MSLAGDIGFCLACLLDGRSIALSSFWIFFLSGVISPILCKVCNVEFLVEHFLLSCETLG